jgi:hypothetical protein
MSCKKEGVNLYQKSFYEIYHRGQCYKTFYAGNLLPFHGNTDILCYKVILHQLSPWNGSKLLEIKNTQYCSNLPPHFNTRKRRYHGKLPEPMLKTFFGRNLQIFVISQTWKACQGQTLQLITYALNNNQLYVQLLPGGNLLKHFTAVMFGHSLVIYSFHVIKQYHSCNHYRMTKIILV